MWTGRSSTATTRTRAPGSKAFAVHGIAVAFERVRLAIGMGGDKLMPAVADIEADSPQGKSISKRRGEIFKERFLPTLRAFPGVRELVERFANDGFTLAVASSAEKDELTHLLEIAGVGRSDQRRQPRRTTRRTPSRIRISWWPP